MGDKQAITQDPCTLPTSIFIRCPAAWLAAVFYPPHMQAAAAAAAGHTAAIQHRTQPSDAAGLTSISKPASKRDIPLQAANVPHLDTTSVAASQLYTPVSVYVYVYMPAVCICVHAEAETA